ncbi:MAG: ATP-dependent DNA helicase, partial [Chloroflexota bacterium]
RQKAMGYGGNTIGAQLMAQLGATESISPEAMFLVSRDRPERLADTGSTAPINVADIEHALAVDGPFSRCMDGYEPRSQQLEMAQAVATNLSNGGQLLVEAGTGTGKSLGYLLPAALLAIERGEPVVISTATIALQDQLLNKDIPTLVEAGRKAHAENPNGNLAKLRDLSATVLKGRSNYLCLRRWFLAQREPVADPVEAELHAKVTAWLQHTDTGDRAELRLSPEQQQRWKRLSEEEGACVPSHCVFHRRNQCFLFRARHEAEASHLIIVNHSLLLSDLMRGGSVLPRFGHLIVDEAQHLESEATRQASFSVSQRRVSSLIDRILDNSEPGTLGGALGIAHRTLSAVQDGEIRDATRSIQSAIDSIQPMLEGLRRGFDRVFISLYEFMINQDQRAGGHEQRMRLTNGLRNDASWTQIEIEWDSVAERIDAITRILAEARGAVQPLDEDLLATASEISTELELVENELQSVRRELYATLCQSEEGLIVWLTRNQQTDEVSVNAAPLHVADILQQELYPKLESLTLTSATLSTEGTFSFIRERLGLEDAEGLQVPSPFDYKASTLVAVAEDVPDPNQPGHQKAIQSALIELCRASRGRAMVLFTSHSALQNSYHAIKRDLEAEGILVLGQRVDGSPRQLLERLSDHPETVLLGTNSFWEGVDIVGDALSLLIITRLPFSVPTDPIFAARSELFDNSFMEYAVPQAILRFKQGFGRLIRSSNDRGVVAVLDRRVISKRYGEAFLASLPDTDVQVAPVSRISQQVARWLQVPSVESSLRRE